jgi:manganese transport protein
MLRRLGPGFLVTAAFIGPGTVTVASKAGAQFGHTLLFAVAFSVFAALVFQEMAARLGIVSGQGLGESIRTTLKHPLLRFFAIALVITAIGFGNAAYQTGNLTGAAAGISQLTGIHPTVCVIAIGLVCMVLVASLRTQNYLQMVLVVLVIFMSLLFLISALVARPSVSEIASGTFIPQITSSNIAIVIGLIGTTVVPYNLFLHSSGAAKNWQGVDPAKAIWESRLDTLLSVGVGGLITAAIVSTAASAFHQQGIQLNSISEIADQLRPSLGNFASSFFLLGLFAAGLTSAITAPLAAAYATSGCLGWKSDASDFRFTLIAWAIILFGMITAIIFGRSPAQTIIAAQVANGLILPLVTLFLLIVVNRPSILGAFANRWITNLLGGTTLLIVTGLGIYNIVRVFLG